MTNESHCSNIKIFFKKKMSLKQPKSQEERLNSPEPLPDQFIKAPKRIWKNTWSFNLHKRFPLHKEEDCPKHQREIKKKIKKYSGKKILYILKVRDLKALFSRSKLLKSAEFEETKIYKDSLKYKGNLVLIGASIRFSDYCFQKEKSSELKKVLKYCQEAQVTIWTHLHLRLLQYMLSVQKLSVDLTAIPHIDALGRIISNLLKLEAIEVRYIDPMQNCNPEMEILIFEGQSINENSSQKKFCKFGFFTQLHKLSSLKRVKFICDYEIIQDMGLEQDLDQVL